MQSYEHKKLIEAFTKLAEVPADSQAFAAWIEAEAHFEFLRINANSNEIAVCASGDHSLVHSLVVPDDRLALADHEDLLQWNIGPHTPIAGYVTGGGRGDYWIERGLSGTGAKTLDNAMQLVFARTFEGWTGLGRNYYELHQEYAHLTDIHWRPENRAYCRFNERGDLQRVVSVSNRDDKGNSIGLVSFNWEPLEEYLAVSHTALVRMFDFTLFRPGTFSGWSGKPEEQVEESSDFFYRRKTMAGHAGYTRGVQIIRPRRSTQAIFTAITDRWSGKTDAEYVEFIAHDWRNQCVTRISTDPACTTNYFQAEGNSLPFELSPAFFNPEVLLKYKGDRDKYTVGERTVSCRTAWHLKGIDVNEAGQVHAYICDLRGLPYAEQLYWASYNEEPKANVSRRAIEHDFFGQWTHVEQPLWKVMSLIRQWRDDKVAWWTIRDEKLFDRVNTPVTASRDEWAEAFMDLAKLVVEGFETRAIRARLDRAKVPYDKEDRTIVLLEKLLNASHDGEIQKLEGLRKVQNLRSKAKGHAGGSEAEQLAHDAVMEHETFGKHFQHVCAQVADELETIEKLMS